MLNNRNLTSLPMMFIYILSFLLLWEWLRPLPIITDTGNLHVFIWFTLFCFFVLYIRLSGFIAIPLIFIAIMYALHDVFFEGSFFREGFSTLVWFGEDFARNIGYLLQREVNVLSYEFRSLLLLLVLAIISYLIHFWIYHVKKIFYFLLLTVIYVTVIDTFTIYDATSAIVRIVIFGFLLTTILFKRRLEQKEQFNSDDFRGKAWTNMLVGIITVVSVVAVFLPKYEPVWPDPLPMVKGVISGEGGGGTVQTVGYSLNDERLGGGFIQDERVVFTAISKERHYWRGESKEIYTGHGWISIDPELNKTFRYSDYYDENVAVQLYENKVSKEKQEATISMANDHRFWHFFYPGELVEVDQEKLEFYADNRRNQPFRFLIDYVSGKVGTTADEAGNALFLNDYTITYYSPEFKINDLVKASENDPEHIKNLYLQLPDLPDRVGLLAEEITNEYDNRYDKVKAIEDYFSKNDFHYETQDVPIPEPGQDYVDQFLFETRRGYCDNYSTSMVVLLRTLDIPARWVKGFTQGELVEYVGKGYREYEISNTNAHSWVEVYFPDVGWVPFEPTKGFSHTFDFVREEVETDSSVSRDDFERDQQTAPLRENDPENPFLPLDDDWYSEGGSSSSKTNNLQSLNLPYKLVWFVIVFSLIVFVLHKHHKKIITLFFFYMFKLKSNNRNVYVKAYQRLLWLLALNGYKRSDEETLREYASRIDKQLRSTEMEQLTLKYEKLYYGNGEEQQIWGENKHLWEVLVKKMSS